MMAFSLAGSRRPDLARLPDRPIAAGFETAGAELGCELGSFYERHCDDVRATVLRIVQNSRYCSFDIDDLVQTSFLRFLEAMQSGKVDNSSNPGGYIAVISRNATYDWILGRRREQPITHAAVPTALRSQAAEGDREQVAERRHDISKVRAYLGHLSSELFNLYFLRFDRQLSQLQVARDLGISRQRVRTLEGRLLRDARQSLRVSVRTC
jgi:RNA polymerase sigma factor (sigma-70 family)